MSEIKIVLEHGVNHEGNIEKAVEAIEVAAKLGVWGIKFQYYDAKELGKGFDFNLKLKDFTRINYVAKKNGIKWGISLFDSAWSELDYFIKAGVNFVKFAGNQSHKIGKLIYLIPCRIVISAQKGLGPYLGNLAHHYSGTYGKSISILAVNSDYPCLNPPLDRVNENIGYSCHTPGYEAMFLASLKNPPMIEKHFTLDHNASGFRDHKHAITPEEFLIYKKRMEEISSG